MTRIHFAIFFFGCSFFLPGGAASEEKDERRSIDFGLAAEIQNIGYFKSDSDFDRTEPYYYAEGQTAGFLGTIFTPKISLDASGILRIYYEAELGINMWSKNNPDQPNPLAQDIFLLKHREIWSEAYLVGRSLGVKAGYQRFIDPTGLFFNHWIGAGTLLVEAGRTRYSFSLGQVPDSTYEGIEFTDNNFKHDTFVIALRGDRAGEGGVGVSAGVYGLIDTSVVGRPNVVLMPCIDLSFVLGELALSVDAALQAGEEMNVTVTGGDQLNLAWALQGRGEYLRQGWRLGFGALLLSADDDYENNEINSAFYYSGKTRSLTLIMTEDEMRDKYDNLDEQMGSRKAGAFYLMRSGMALVDVTVGKKVLGFLEPAICLGGLFVLNPDNALGHAYGGLEADLLLRLAFSKNVALEMAGGAVFPGKALSAHVNRIDLEATDPLFMLEAILDVRI